jgi:isopenicillin-N N-acyltransferase-like protein
MILRRGKWETVLKLATVFEDRLRADHPDLVEEMEGVAQGADVDFISILALNVRSE